MSDSTADAELRLARPGEPPAELTDVATAPPAGPPAPLAALPVPPAGPPAPPAATPLPPAPPAAPPALPALPAVVPTLSPGSPTPGRRARLPWIIAAVAVVVALASVGVAVAGQLGDAEAETGERGFASPEAAVEYFVGRVAAGDLAGASGAFAVESLVDGYSFQKVSEIFGVVSDYDWLPATSDGYRALDEDFRRGELARELQYLVQAVAAPTTDFDRTIVLGDGVTAAEIEADLAPEGLEGLSLMRVDEVMGPDVGINANAVTLAEAYGADEVREVAVLYGTPDGPVLGGMQLLRYGDEWHIWNLRSNVLDVLFGVEPITELQYMAVIAQVQG